MIVEIENGFNEVKKRSLNLKFEFWVILEKVTQGLALNLS